MVTDIRLHGGRKGCEKFTTMCTIGTSCIVFLAMAILLLALLMLSSADAQGDHKQLSCGFDQCNVCDYIDSSSTLSFQYTDDAAASHNNTGGITEVENTNGLPMVNIEIVDSFNTSIDMFALVQVDDVIVIPLVELRRPFSFQFYDESDEQSRLPAAQCNGEAIACTEVKSLCRSRALHIGDHFGNLKLIKFNSRNGSSRTLCSQACATDPLLRNNAINTETGAKVRREAASCVPRYPCDGCIDGSTKVQQLLLQYTGSINASNSQQSSTVEGSTSNSVVNIAVYNNLGKMSGFCYKTHSLRYASMETHK